MSSTSSKITHDINRNSSKKAVKRVMSIGGEAKRCGERNYKECGEQTNANHPRREISLSYRRALIEMATARAISNIAAIGLIGGEREKPA